MSLEFIVAGVYEFSKLIEPKEGVVGIYSWSVRSIGDNLANGL